MVHIRIHKSYRDVVSICDSDLIGKKFEQGRFQLDIKENFYKGEEKADEEIKNLIENFSKEDATFNIVGKNSVKLALETGIIPSEGVKKISGIPYSMVLL